LDPRRKIDVGSGGYKVMRNFAFYTTCSLFNIILPFDAIALATNMVVK
jgi:hypothetical protein